MKYIIFLSLFIFSSLVIAADNESLFLDKDGTLKESAIAFSECSGIYQAYSEFFKSSHPATADYLNSLKNRAEFSALYLFTVIKIAKDGLPRKYGDATPHVESTAYGAYTQVSMLLEIENIESANVSLEKCTDLNELQAILVNMMRNVIYE